MLGRVPSGIGFGWVESTPAWERLVASTRQIEMGSAQVGRNTILTGDDHARGRASRRGCRGVDQQGWQAQQRQALEARRLWEFVVRHGPLRSRLQRIRRRTRIPQSPPAASRPKRSLSGGDANKPSEPATADQDAGLVCVSAKTRHPPCQSSRRGDAMKSGCWIRRIASGPQTVHFAVVAERDRTEHVLIA